MARGDLSSAAIALRITSSPLALTLVFPDKRNAPVLAGPTTRPTSPLTGPVPTQTLTPPASDPERDALTVPCLWLDSPLAETVASDQRSYPLQGWMAEATALARVVAGDVWVDPTDLSKGTYFEQCAHVAFRGGTYRVLKVDPMGPSFRAPHSYSVWLVGALKS